MLPFWKQFIFINLCIWQESVLSYCFTSVKQSCSLGSLASNSFLFIINWWNLTYTPLNKMWPSKLQNSNTFSIIHWCHCHCKKLLWVWERVLDPCHDRYTSKYRTIFDFFLFTYHWRISNMKFCICVRVPLIVLKNPYWYMQSFWIGSVPSLFFLFLHFHCPYPCPI